LTTSPDGWVFFAFSHGTRLPKFNGEVHPFSDVFETAAGSELFSDAEGVVDAATGQFGLEGFDCCTSNDSAGEDNGQDDCESQEETELSS
jgi:hypothetical protein